MFKVNTKNTRTTSMVVFIVNSEQILHIVLVNGSWDLVQLSNFNGKMFMLKGLFLY